MTLHLKGGRIIDPENGRDGIGDIYIAGGKIVASPPAGDPVQDSFDLDGRVVMAGAIDIHTHVASENVSAAKTLLAERRWDGAGPLATGALPTLGETGALYAQMGFTTVVEPAMPPNGAIQAQTDLSLIPFLDRAALAILGNDGFALGLMRDGTSGSALADYVSRTLGTAKAIGVKVINPGGVAAFKDNIRSFSLDDTVPEYGLTSRQIVQAMQAAVAAAGIAHPVHLHCNNLGLPGNVETALGTIEAAEGNRLHLTHLQFYSYGASKRGGLTSGAVRLAEAVNANKNITVDVGQVMSGPTVTISADVPRQFAARRTARPRKSIISDREGNGFGIVPYNYIETNKVTALQWAIGLELFLLIQDPWQVFFTTDHPNGAHFTTYPQIIHLLMDAGERARWIERLPKAAFRTSVLAEIKREYTLSEIATMTRASPARLYGLRDRGHLGPGAVADIAVYTPDRDLSRMFGRAYLVFKNGSLIIKDGKPRTKAYGRTHYVSPAFDPRIDTKLAAYYDEKYGARLDQFTVPERLLSEARVFEEQPCSAS